MYMVESEQLMSSTITNFFRQSLKWMALRKRAWLVSTLITNALVKESPHYKIYSLSISIHGDRYRWYKWQWRKMSVGKKSIATYFIHKSVDLYRLTNHQCQFDGLTITTYFESLLLLLFVKCQSLYSNGNLSPLKVFFYVISILLLILILHIIIVFIINFLLLVIKLSSILVT